MKKIHLKTFGSKLLSIFLLILILTQVFVIPVSAQKEIGGDNLILSSAPLNSDFVTYSSSGEKTDGEGHGLGYTPAPNSLSSAQITDAVFRSYALPVSYDLRTLNRVTPVQNQNPAGCCWAFAACASAESSYVTDSGVSNTQNYFSVNHMKNLTGNLAPYGWDWDTNNGGGNAYKAAAYLARGDGMVNILEDPYNPTGTYYAPEDSMTQINHVMNVMWLPDKTSYTDNNHIKQAIMNCGAVAVSINWDNSYYNGTTHSFYDPVTSHKGTANHEVVVVGWDDNYSASNFSSAPPGNGAYILKNSWGTGWGENGYFYVSYYDNTFGFDELAVFDEVEFADNYKDIYAYDPFGNTSYIGNNTSTLYGSVMYTASRSDLLTSVSTYMGMPGSSYQIQVYLNSPAGNPTGGMLVSAATTSGSVTYAGYYNIDLASSVQLTSGQRFAIVIRYTTPGSTHPCPIQDKFDNWTSKVTAQAGRSFASADGINYSDLTTIGFPTATINIDAFTSVAVTGVGAISGTAQVGSTLTAGAVTPAGATVTYRWMVADTAGGTYSPISSATNSSYTLTTAEHGKYIKVAVTGTGYYVGTVTSAAAGPVTTPLTGIGAITGTSQSGSTLTAGALTPSGATVAYQWKSSGTSGGPYTNISGATASTYTLTDTQVGKYVVVTATGTGSYSGSVTSAERGPVDPLITAVTGIGAISGSAQVGSTLTAGALTPSGATVTYQWKSSGTSGGPYTNISGATASTYTLTSSELDQYIVVTATGSGSYTGSVTSAETGPVTTPVTGIGAISGTTEVGTLLTAGAVSPSGATVTYRWMAADTAGGTYSPISGATSSSYTLTSSELGKYIKVVVTGTGSYSGTATSAAAGPVTASVTGIGAITGSAQVGSTLTAGAVSPAGATVTYQWKSSSTSGGTYTNISGATASTYTLTSSELGQYIVVTATGSGNYTGSVTSAETGLITTAITGVGAITGTAQVGSMLTAGTVSPAGATVTYQWKSSSTSGGPYTNISGATGNTYTLTASEQDLYIVVSVTGSGNYTGTVNSAQRGPVLAPATPVTGIGAIGGTAQVGSTLTAGTLTPSGATVTYQWMAADTAGGTYSPISGATNSTYTLTSSEHNKYIKVTATGTGSYSGTVTSSETGPVTTAVTGIGAISGSAQVGSTLTTGTLTPSGATVTYQWKSSGTSGGPYTNISGATASTYTLTSSELDQYIVVTATGSGSYTGSVTSAETGPVTTPVTGIGAISGTTEVGTLLTAGAVSPSGATVTYRWMAADTAGGTYSPISGATSSSYTLTSSELGKYIEVVVTGTGSYSGTATSAAAGPVTASVTGIGAITGSAQVGSALTAGAVSPVGATVTYQWKSSSTSGGPYTNISGATASTYTLTAAEHGKYVIVTVTATGSYTGSAESAEVGPVNSTAITGIGSVTGTAKVGFTLTAGTLSPAGAAVTYQWMSAATADGTYSDIAGATQRNYTLTSTDVNQYIKVAVTGMNGYTGTVTSSSVGPVAAASSGGGGSMPGYIAAISGCDGIETLPVDFNESTGEESITLDAQTAAKLFSGTDTRIAFPTISDATLFSLSIPVSALESAQANTVTIFTGSAYITLSSDMFTGLSLGSNNTAKISIKSIDIASLPADVQTAVGGRPIFEFTLTINGVKKDWNNPSAPVTVSIPYEPTEEELDHPDSIVIWYIDGAGDLCCVQNGSYDAETGLITFSTTHFSYYAVGYNQIEYKDVSGWYVPYVEYLSARGIINGKSSNTFCPEASITRAEFMMILARVSGDDLSSYSTSSFADVSTSDWYFEAVQWAYDIGIAEGYGGNFNPNVSITRQDLAVLISRYADYIDFTLPEIYDVKIFTDESMIADYAIEAVTKLQSAGFISGYSDGSFAPLNGMKRSEVAKIVALFMQTF